MTEHKIYEVHTYEKESNLRLIHNNRSFKGLLLMVVVVSEMVYNLGALV